MILVYAVATIIGIVVTASLFPHDSLLLSVTAAFLGGNLSALATGLIIVQWRSFFRQQETIRPQETIGRKDAVPQGVIWC